MNKRAAGKLIVGTFVDYEAPDGVKHRAVLVKKLGDHQFELKLVTNGQHLRATNRELTASS